MKQKRSRNHTKQNGTERSEFTSHRTTDEQRKKKPWSTRKLWVRREKIEDRWVVGQVNDIGPRTNERTNQRAAKELTLTSSFQAQRETHTRVRPKRETYWRTDRWCALCCAVLLLLAGLVTSTRPQTGIPWIARFGLLCAAYANNGEPMQCGWLAVRWMGWLGAWSWG